MTHLVAVYRNKKPQRYEIQTGRAKNGEEIIITAWSRGKTKSMVGATFQSWLNQLKADRVKYEILRSIE